MTLNIIVNFLIQKLFVSIVSVCIETVKQSLICSTLFKDCFTVSKPVHMESAQSKWNGASAAQVLH